jgi:hypothetical protein
METVNVLLEDGTLLSNLIVNGNNYISNTKLDESIFNNNLGSVIITTKDDEEKHTNMELVHLTQYGDEWWFTLRDIPENEQFLNQLRADLDYTMMMSDID